MASYTFWRFNIEVELYYTHKERSLPYDSQSFEPTFLIISFYLRFEYNHWVHSFLQIAYLNKKVISRFLEQRNFSLWQEPWSSGYGTRLMFQRSWVRIILSLLIFLLYLFLSRKELFQFILLLWIASPTMLVCQYLSLFLCISLSLFLNPYLLFLNLLRLRLPSPSQKLYFHK